MSNIISIKIEGLDQFEADVKRGASQIEPLVNQAMRDSVNTVKNDAQLKAPYKTGNLRRSIFTLIENSGFKGTVGVDPAAAPYGIYMELGTKPHIIMAKNAKVLADRKNNIIFGKIVHHPGTQAHPFMRPALEDNIDKIKAFFEKALLKVVEVMAGK